MNALAHFWTLKAFLPHMIKENKGHIVSGLYVYTNRHQQLRFSGQHGFCRRNGWHGSDEYVVLPMLRVDPFSSMYSRVLGIKSSGGVPA